MLIQGQVGPVSTTSSVSAGTIAPGRQGNMGELIVSEVQPRYYEAAYRRALFNGANQVGTVTTVGLATTYTGLCLSNPVGSTVNLVLTKVGFAFLVAFAAGSAIGLMQGYNSGTNVTHTTPGTPRSAFFGAGAVGVGLIDVACTFPTAPFVTHIFAAGLTGAITTAPMVPGTLPDLEGGVILPPGAYAAIYTSTVSAAASLFGSMQWLEVPV